MQVTYPRDRSGVDLGAATQTRVGKVIEIDGAIVTIEYEPITSDELDRGAIEKCAVSDLYPAGDNKWKLNRQVKT